MRNKDIRIKPSSTDVDIVGFWGPSPYSLICGVDNKKILGIVAAVNDALKNEAIRTEYRIDSPYMAGLVTYRFILDGIKLTVNEFRRLRDLLVESGWSYVVGLHDGTVINPSYSGVYDTSLDTAGEIFYGFNLEFQQGADVSIEFVP